RAAQWNHSVQVPRPTRKGISEYGGSVSPIRLSYLFDLAPGVAVVRLLVKGIKKDAVHKLGQALGIDRHDHKNTEEQGVQGSGQNRAPNIHVVRHDMIGIDSN